MNKIKLIFSYQISLWVFLFLMFDKVSRCGSIFDNKGSCYSNNGNKYRYFSTFTDYQDASARISSASINLNGNPLTLQFDCQATSVWQYGREGTTIPYGEQISVGMLDSLYSLKDDILMNHRINKGELCDEDIYQLQQWQGFHEELIDQAGELSSRGNYVLFSSAQRYQAAFLHKDEDFNSNNFEFYYGGNTGAMQSAESLIQGWIPRAFADVFTLEPFLHKWQPQSDQCPIDGLDNDVYYKEAAESLIHEVLRSVSDRLGFQRLITEVEAMAMYDACRITVTLQPSLTSPWCAVFSSYDLKIIEYVLDTDYYRRYGHGLQKAHRGTLRTSCTAVKNLLEFFQKDVDGAFESGTEQETKGRIIVSDLQSVLKLITVLGGRTDSLPVNPQNFDPLNSKRWRTSLIVPFGGHIMLSLVKCGSEHYVRTFIQEGIEQILNCSTYCPWEEFKTKVQKITAWCSEDSCSSSNNLLPMHLIVLLSFVFLISNSQHMFMRNSIL